MAVKNENVSTNFLLGISILSFILVVLLVTGLFPRERQLVYSYVRNNIESVSSEILFKMLSNEIHIFLPVVEKNDQSSVVSMALELATNINIGDVRSLIGNEIPGFSIYRDEIIVSGKGTNFTNLPIESSPPIGSHFRRGGNRGKADGGASYRTRFL